jgi:hypothetical protein
LTPFQPIASGPRLLRLDRLTVARAAGLVALYVGAAKLGLELLRAMQVVTCDATAQAARLHSSELLDEQSVRAEVGGALAAHLAFACHGPLDGGDHCCSFLSSY